MAYTEPLDKEQDQKVIDMIPSAPAHPRLEQSPRHSPIAAWVGRHKFWSTVLLPVVVVVAVGAILCNIL